MATDSSAARDELANALQDRNNYVVSKAAEVASELRLDELIPELLAAFDRFFVDSAKSDPQCLAKNALARALKDLGHHGAPAYLKGMAHRQLEPAFGGRADTAATLRGICALALIDCPLDHLEILTHLTDALADPDITVRMEAADAIQQFGRAEGALVLRLKLLSGDAERAVIGQCFAAYLNLATDGAVEFVGSFLHSSDEAIQLESVSALAQCRDPIVMDLLRQYWQEPVRTLDSKRAVVLSLGASPLPDSAAFLLMVVADEPPALAADAIAALASSRFRNDIAKRLATVVASRSETEVRSAFEQSFSRPS